MELVIVIGQASASALRDATGAVPGDRDPAQGAALAVAALAKLTELGDRPMPAQEQAQRQEQLQRLQMAPGANQGAQARPPPTAAAARSDAARGRNAHPQRPGRARPRG